MAIPTAAKLAINVVIRRLMGSIEHSFRNVRNVVGSGLSAFSGDGRLTDVGSDLRTTTASDPLFASPIFNRPQRQLAQPPVR